MCRNESGFTLVEMMVSLVVTMLIVASAYAVFAVQNKSANVQNEVATMQQNGRIAMDALVSEIRRGAYNNPENPAGATVQVAASGTSITIQKDKDSDGKVSDDPSVTPTDDEESITLQLNGTQLVKIINQNPPVNPPVTQVLADNVTLLTFAPAGVTDPPSVLVTLNVRTKNEDPSWTATSNGFNVTGSPTDGLARTRNYQKTIWVRNLNL